MRSTTLIALSVLAVCIQPVLAQEGSPRQLRTRATEQMIDSQGDQALRDYAEEHLAPQYRTSFADDAALLAHLATIRDEVAPVGNVGIMIDDAGLVRLHIANRDKKSIVALRLEPEPPHRILELTLESSETKDAAPRVTWESLESTMQQAEAKGFSGSVLVLRDGEVVLDRGYGYADPERKHAVTPTTLFAIGSTPIDFTHGAILKLEEMGKVSLDDPIGKYFDDVPADKQAITLDYLRTGRSGLIDFPGIEGVDDNLDLSWIDRDEFMRRIFDSTLVFEPGTREQHSHCAWGVLAAVIEIASGQDYDSFLREHFFGPAGMKRTGNYPLAKTFPASEVAVGLGGNMWGEVNSPQYWGETSWLVLGSGGMVSTPRDLRRWRTFLRSGEALGADAQRRYGIDGVFAGVGGNDRGFINCLGFRGADAVIFCSNSHFEMGDSAAELGMALVDMVLDE